MAFEFPAFLKLEHQQNAGARSSFMAEMASIGSDGKRQFEQAFGEIGKVVERSLSGFRNGGLKFDIDVSGLRQAATEADHTYQRLTALRDAAASLAARTGDTTVATTKYVQALQAQVREADSARRAADAQVTTYSRLQTEIDRTVRKNEALARSYRETFTEAARASNFATRSQQAVNAGFAPGLGRAAKSASASASVFESQSYAPRFGGKSGLDALMSGSASLDRAAASGATLESVLGRVSSKGQEVRRALDDAATAAARLGQEQQQAANAAAAAYDRAAASSAEMLGRIQREQRASGEAASQRAAAAASEYARELNLVRQAIDPTLAAQQQLDIELARADRFFEQGALSAREYGLAINAAAGNFQATVTGAREGTTANHLLANSTRAVRVAMLQSGQQLQDVAISLYSGQQAAIVFAQQLPQLAFGLSGLTESANRTQQRIGAIATFLSGPWGLAVGLAVGVLGTLVAKLFTTGEEAKKTGSAMDRLTNRLDLTKNSYSALIDVVNDYNDAQSKSNALTYQAIQAAEGKAAALLKEARARLAAAEADDPTRFAGDSAQAATLAGASGSLQSSLLGRIAALEKKLLKSNVAAGIERTRRQSDPRYNIEVGFNERIARLEEKRLAGTIKQIEFERERLSLLKQQEAALKQFDETKKATRGSLETTSLILPVNGRTVGQFGENRGSRNHAGIDLAVPVGTSVKAPGAGVVIEAGTLPGYGNVVFINHGAGTISRIAHLSRIGVSKGDQVLQGDVIGLSGGARGAPGSGNSRGPHVHYEVRRGGRAVNPTGTYPTDALGAAAKAEEIAEAARKAQDRLQEFGERSAESIARVNERFNEQPRLIDQAAQATRQLDDVIKDLADRKPPGFEAMIADAEKAKSTVQDALVRPFREMQEQALLSLAAQTLTLQGMDAEAVALQRIYQLEQQLGPLTEERKAEVLGIARAEDEVAKAIDRARETQAIYLDTTRSVRSEVEAILSGQGKLSNFKNIFKQMQGRLLTENLFGDVFRDMDAWVRKNTGLGTATDEFTQATEKAGSAAFNFADVLNEAADRIGGVGAANDNGGIGGIAADISNGIGNFLKDAVSNVAAEADNGASAVQEIVVVGKTMNETAKKLTPASYADRLSTKMGKAVGDALSGIIGGRAGGIVGKLAGGAFGGYATAGLPGAVLGSLRKIEGLPEGLQKGLDKAFKGAQTGTQVAGIGKALGLKMSTTGSQIGGALGSATGIPGADIIGSIIGGVIGGLLKKPKTGKVSIGGIDGALGITSTGGNTNSFIKAATQSGDSIISGVQNIADQLGATVNAALGSVTVGIRDGKWRVNTSGTSLKKSGGAQDFGKDGAEAAAEAAMRDLINDGVLGGIRAVTLNVLKSGKDLQSALQKALDVEGVFSRLKAIEDPVGAALDTIDKQFTRLRDTMISAGGSAEDLAALEKLYGYDRAAAVKQAMEASAGSLRDLLSQLTIGDSGLSLRDRLGNARAAYDPLAARVKAGDVTAFDDFSKAAQDMLGISRELYGSQGGYFAVFNEIKTITQAALDAQQAIADASAGRDSPFSQSSVPATDNANVVAAVNSQTDALLSGLNAVNDNLGTLIAAALAGGSASASGWSGNSFF